MSGRRLPSLRAPWVAGLMSFLVLASAAAICLSRTGDSAPVPQSVLDSRQESTEAAQEAISRSLDGGMGSLAEIAAVVDESLSRPDRALPVLSKGRPWKSLYVVDRASREVVAQAGAPAQPALLGDPAPSEAGMRLAQVDTGRQIVEYTPIGKAADTKYLLVGQVDPDRLGELLAAAGPEGAWLLDKSGSVIVGPDNRRPPLGVIDPGLEPGAAASGSRAQHAAGQEEVVAWAAMDGTSSSTALGWTVASEQATTEPAAFAEASGRRAITVGAGLAVLTVIVFAAFYLLLLRPIRLLSRVATSSRRTAAKAPKHGEAGRIALVLTHARAGRSGRYRPLALLTWSAGAALFLGAAATVTVLPSFWPVDAIPASVAAEQQARSSLAAHQVQSLLDSGVSDLTAVATGVRMSKDTETPAKLLSQLMSTRDRYRGVVYLAPNGELRAKSGEDVDAAAIKAADEPALAVDTPQGGSPRVFVSAPVTGEKAGRLIAEFAPSALSGPLSSAGPGNTWFLDADREVIGTTTASGLSSRPDLAQAVRDAAGGPGHALRDVDGGRHLVSWAPVTSTLLTGLTVVTDRPETPPTHLNEKRDLILLGTLIAVLTIVIFARLYVVVIRPLSALAEVAERLGRGDTGAPVIVRGYDQLGLVARGLERTRRDLIRSIATTPPTARRPTPRPRPATATHSRTAAGPPPPSSRRTPRSPTSTTTRRPRR
ncbi:hypothetical protein DMA12_27115 [Amycolatopsis balhimycina DSM 5908]|uniref:HAMP domain-containing protein n=1 Tax=Amycolatopsis balhimycina DSM 5908 TaxID=1081091 RepID=A0A428WBQ5_AMYBA|nr:hypothetical protein [Amycolatopsis balhimycina]RSM40357.1 hypothetical protein DMA12_27115 [Amycolatopsis balhimycina DSM 5908]